MNRQELVRSGLERTLGRPLGQIHVKSVGGGCINRAAIVETERERFFLKWNDHPLPAQFEAEAAGLRALHACESSLVIPAPIAWHDDASGGSFLVLEYLEPGRRRADFDELLGRGLAELHRCSTERGFGFDMDGYCGATPQPNGWMQRWPEFYRERRLGHQVDLARAKGLAGADADRAQRLVERLGEWIHDDEPPALIHGDLWSGNLHVAPDGRPCLIDPAAYFAHREAELGMMALFGGFAPRVWEAYHEAFPLAKGWRSRLDLYELYHVLNHFNLFGGGYAQQAMGIVRQYVG